MITLRNVTLRRGARVLLENLNWTIFHKQRIGIIGANGTGKTSLFSLLLGELQSDAGDVDIPRQIKLAYVAQENEASDQSALDYVLDGDEELRSLQQALQTAEAADNGMEVARIYEKLGNIDAYTAPSRAAQLLSGLGFNHVEQQKTMREFSGGWRVRLNLAKALMRRSDVLLLDEPTNHLDLDAVLWLEKWLENYHGTLLIISHDREFLDDTVGHIAHLYNQTIKVYTGNYSTFETQRANDLALQQSAYEKQQKQIEHMQGLINRFRAKASKAKQAQSRIKALARMEVLSAVQTDSEFQFSFKKADHCPNPLLTLDEVKVAYGEKVVLHDLNLSLTPRDRIAVLGPNGAGKSTFIKLLAGELSPASGVREMAPGLRIGYFAQHQVDYLQLSDTPLVHLRRLAPNTPEVDLRKFLGSFAFSGDKVLQPIQHFSGGEKSRLALALIVWQKPNLLLLDEPTNHLDLEMRNALSMALQEYEGAMILVSHDRFLVRTTTDQLMLVAEGKLQPFNGDLDEYQQWLIEYRKQQLLADQPERMQTSSKERRQQEAKLREQRKPLLQKIQRLEDQIERLEKEASSLELALADATIYDAENKEKLQQMLLKQAEIKKSIMQSEGEWLMACEERDKN